MRNALLVARREYIAYVTAWGFWLGLLLTPLGLSLGLLIPSLVESSTPARYYAVIDETGDYADIVAERFDRQREDVARAVLRTTYIVSGRAEDVGAAVEAFDRDLESGLSSNEALRANAPEGVPLTLPAAEYYAIELPSQSIEDLTPFLTGEALIDGPLGPRPLYAVLVYKPGDVVEHWSDDVVSRDLLNTATRASIELSRRQALTAEGVDPGLLTRADDAALPVKELSPTSGSGEGGQVTFADRAPFVAAIALSFGLWLLIFSVVNFLLTGTIEERSNKIFDALLTSTSLAQLLTGKLLGVLMLSLTLMAVWSSFGLIFALTAGNSMPDVAGDLLSAIASPRLIIPALISFMLGYLMYGAAFLALGSLCDTIQEAQSLMSPIIIIMLLPLIMLPITIGNPNSGLVAGLTWVPLFTPFLLILRIPMEPPLWEIGLALVMMFAFTLLALWVSTRVYRAGAVHGAGVAEARAWFAGLFGQKKKAGHRGRFPKAEPFAGCP